MEKPLKPVQYASSQVIQSDNMEFQDFWPKNLMMTMCTILVIYIIEVNRKTKRNNIIVQHHQSEDR